jgi:hypothetical protein
MPEIGTSGLMSGDGKRGGGLRPKLPRPSSTLLLVLSPTLNSSMRGAGRRDRRIERAKTRKQEQDRGKPSHAISALIRSSQDQCRAFCR